MAGKRKFKEKAGQRAAPTVGKEAKDFPGAVNDSGEEQLLFQVGEEVECRSFVQGYWGAWFRSKVVKIKGSNYRMKYLDFDDRDYWHYIYEIPPKSLQREAKLRKAQLMIRPKFPVVRYASDPGSSFSSDQQCLAIILRDWEPGDFVDWLWRDCYWTCEILAIINDETVKVKCPDYPDEYTVEKEVLRPALEWSPVFGWRVKSPKSNPCVMVLNPQAREETGAAPGSNLDADKKKWVVSSSDEESEDEGTEENDETEEDVETEKDHEMFNVTSRPTNHAAITEIKAADRPITHAATTEIKAADRPITHAATTEIKAADRPGTNRRVLYCLSRRIVFLAKFSAIARARRGYLMYIPRKKAKQRQKMEANNTHSDLGLEPGTPPAKAQVDLGLEPGTPVAEAQEPETPAAEAQGDREANGWDLTMELVEIFELLDRVKFLKNVTLHGVREALAMVHDL